MNRHCKILVKMTSIEDYNQSQMSKLTSLRDALKRNEDLVLVRTTGLVMVNTEEGYTTMDPPKGSYDRIYGHFVKFHVAPRQGLYTVGELTPFMMRLVHDLKPDSTIDFRMGRVDHSASGYVRFIEGENPETDSLYLSHLYFQEKIGEVKTIETIILGDKELITKSKFGEQKAINGETREIFRSIGIIIFPNEELTKRVLRSYGRRFNPALSEYNIGLKYLEGYR